MTDPRAQDRYDIEQCLFRYVRGVDRKDWDLVRSAYYGNSEAAAFAVLADPVCTGTRIVSATLGMRSIGTLQPIHIWIATLVGHATRCTLSMVRFKQGRWRNIEVGLSH